MGRHRTSEEVKRGQGIFWVFSKRHDDDGGRKVVLGKETER